MSNAGKIVSWSCIFSILFGGCYSSALIAPTGDGKEKIYSGEIKSIVTNDDANYEFDSPPAIVNNAVVGIANGDSIAIPLSQVMLANVKTIDLVTTLLAWSVPIAIVVHSVTSSSAWVWRGAY